jgi:molecular chaperone DnaJ
MYIHVMVETPVNLSKQQKEILQDFSQKDKGHETSPTSAGFFSKVKEFWKDLKE